MIRYIIVSVVSGILFGVLDGLLNANALARKVFEVYQPIARASINVPAGALIDLAYGFALAGIFLLLYSSLPGETGWIKGVSFAVLVWFFRVVMQAASQWMMYEVPGSTVFYLVVAGLVEMLILGLLYGLTLRPAA